MWILAKVRKWEKWQKWQKLWKRGFSCDREIWKGDVWAISDKTDSNVRLAATHVADHKEANQQSPRFLFSIDADHSRRRQPTFHSGMRTSRSSGFLASLSSIRARTRFIANSAPGLSLNAVWTKRMFISCSMPRRYLWESHLFSWPIH